jgi:hypothetical protein
MFDCAFIYFSLSTRVRLLCMCAAQVVLSEQNKVITVTGGGLGDGQYVMQQFHFHWGDPRRPGSEHQLNGKRCVLWICLSLTVNIYGIQNLFSSLVYKNYCFDSFVRFLNT